MKKKWTDYLKQFSYEIIIKGNKNSFLVYDNLDKTKLEVFENDLESFEKLIDFIYYKINGPTSLREESDQ